MTEEQLLEWNKQVEIIRQNRHRFDTRFPYRPKHYQINGKPIERPAEEYRYSYTATCLYKNNWTKEDKMVYSDRLHLWYDNYDEIKEEYLGRGSYFTLFEPEKIEKFLSVLFKQKITLTGIEEECNCSNGYPYWLLYYREEEPTVHYKNGVRVETSKVIMYVNHDQNKGYIISVTDKETNKITYKTYQRKRYINHYANKYGITFIFK